MPATTKKGTSRWLAVLTLCFTAAGATGCGSADDSGGYEVAFLSPSESNKFTQVLEEGMRDVAEKENIELTTFDAQFDQNKQFSQFQDAIATGRFDGIIITALNNQNLVGLAEQAIEDGNKIGVLNQTLGPAFDTVEPQLDGLYFSVLRPLADSGRAMGELTVKACEGIDPCEVGWIWGLKSLPVDHALRDGWESATEGHPNIEIVAEGEGEYTASGGRKVIQDFTQAHPELDVITGEDISLLGGEPILEQAGLISKVKLVGVSSHDEVIQRIADKAPGWFGTSAIFPYEEGRVGMEAMVAALKNDKMSGGIDPVPEIVPGGLITTENADKYVNVAGY